ncbi:MAG: SMC protein-like protein [Bacillota bacterium]|nr:MAG: SMC protein-like protein [Bacillota bacterium]
MIYLVQAEVRWDKVPIEHRVHYPFSLSAVNALQNPLRFHSPVTFIIGENGSGKSTLLEAMAVAYGFNPEGGSKNFSFFTENSHSGLHQFMRLGKGVKTPKTAYFLRAESFYNVATNIDQLDRETGGPSVIDSYGGRSLHTMSHGESFLALMLNRFGPNGFYLLDEPEVALSPTNQLTMLARIHQLVLEGCQFIISTHSPMLMAYPGAEIYQIVDDSIQQVDYKETGHYRITRQFLNNPEGILKRLMQD